MPRTLTKAGDATTSGTLTRSGRADEGAGPVRHLDETARSRDASNVEAVDRYVVRISLLDRPGALGQVASRIGAVGGDIVAIDILQRTDGDVVDEFVIELAGDHLVDLLRSEIHEVDGVRVEDVRRVDPEPAAADD
jgi:ACT domain-containing protein